ncbi:electroneutral sodium bicarbonate exchanger 1-like isoform X2 [Lytechinus variegatus]|uniref:electroneutral sodium bicarbonate exchanger 1-like isoform X2 n=1 Tax=Lytechinus variegatus TaxID=7654 RepID=UPI001BB2AA6D|nr:electroneutral sodium bicarbonate exchanger 1-like isoform X2 [Lytechinus variegatus]
MTFHGFQVYRLRPLDEIECSFDDDRFSTSTPVYTPAVSRDRGLLQESPVSTRIRRARGIMNGPVGEDPEVVVDTGAGRASRHIDNKDISNHRSEEMFGGADKDRKKGHQNGHASPVSNGPSSPMSPAAQILNFENEVGETPQQRVQFLLGGEGENQKETPPVYSEMEELFYDKEGRLLEWKETARWVKYEENVDHGAGRWSKPHVATLSLHSLFELRKFIRNGGVQLNMEAEDLEQIIDLALDHLVATNVLEEDQRIIAREALLTRHRHHKQKKKKEPENKAYNKGRRKSSMFPGMDRSMSDIGRSQSTGNNTVSMEQEAQMKEGEMRKNSSANALTKMPEGARTESRGSVGRVGTSESLDQKEKEVKNEKAKFLRKIPAGAEASNVLVGEVDFVEKPMVAFIRLAEGKILSEITEVPIPTRFVFLLLGPPTEDKKKYREIGRCMATLMTDDVFHEVAYKARDREDLLAGLDEFLEQVTVLPPGTWDPNIRIEPPKQTLSSEMRRQSQHFIHPSDAIKEEDDDKFDLARTGRLFGGLIQDIKKKAPFYWSEYYHALNIQCLASFVFMYIACITPIITFGGLLGDATDDYIAAFESLIGAAICGVAYHLFSGQPLTIIGSTGPILIFETIMFQLCGSFGIDYISFRVWIGFWTCVICIILVATDASALVRYFTRFTEEAFSSLISFIFIVEAFENLFEISHEYPIKTNVKIGEYFDEHAMNVTECMCEYQNETIDPTHYNWTEVTEEDCKAVNGTLTGDCETHHEPVPDVFLFSCALFFGTFVLAYALKNFRNSNFFPTKVRYIISDFGVFMAFLAMTGIDIWVGIPTPKLTVPDTFRPTRPDRGWVIPLFNNPWWTYFAAIVPALLCSILIFMDQQITAVIVNRRENKLKKGFGYHLDLLVIAILLFVMSVLGMPWFVAATVLSINHVDSLRVMSETTIPGEPPKVEGCREQRVTGILVFALIGVSSLLTSVLKFIPMPVLFGVFLYMGISSLRGVQFVDRIMLYLIPAKHQPDYVYLRHVKLWRVHLFTLVQLTCLVLLWLIKTSKASIVFPLMVLAVVFVRKLMEFVFTQYELNVLDDVIPESQKRAKDDEEKILEEEREQKFCNHFKGFLRSHLKHIDSYVINRAASKTIKDVEANAEEGIELPSGTSSFGVQADMDDTRF